MSQALAASLISRVAILLIVAVGLQLGCKVSGAAPVAALKSVMANTSGAVVAPTNLFLTYTRMTNGVTLVQANTNLVMAGPYTNRVGAFSGGAANFGPTGGETSFEFLVTGQPTRIAQSGVLEQVKVRLGSTNNLSAFYVFASKKPVASVASWDQMSISANLVATLVPNADNTLAPNINVSMYDYIGFRAEWTGAGATAALFYTFTGVANVTTYSMVNTATDTTAFNWTAQTANAGVMPALEYKMRAPVAIVIGDSNAAGRNNSGSATENYSTAETTENENVRNSYGYWVAENFGWSWQNMGIGGEQITNICARLDSDLIEKRPKYALFVLGMNNLAGATTAAGYTNEWNFLLRRVTTNGIIPVICLLPGADVFNNVNDPLVDLWNANLIKLCQDAYPTAIVVHSKRYLSANSPTQSPSTNEYNYATGMSLDGTHRSPLGQRREATATVDAISPPITGTADKRRAQDVRLMADGADYMPGLAFEGSPLTGWFRSGANAWRYVVNTSPKWDIDSSGNWLAAGDNLVDIGASGANRPRGIYASTRFAGPVGTNSTPVYSFSGYLNSGIWYHGGQDTISFSMASSRVLDIFATSLAPAGNGNYDLGNSGGRWKDGYINRAIFGVGTNSDPSITFQGYTDHGFWYHGGQDSISVAFSNARVLDVFTDNLSPAANDAYDLGNSGSRFDDAYIDRVLAEDYAFRAASNYGVSYDGAGPYLNLKTAGVAQWQIDSNGHILSGIDGGNDIGLTSSARPGAVSVSKYVAFGASAAEPAFTNDRQIGYNNGITKFRKRERGTTVINLEDSGLTTLTYAASTAIDLTRDRVFYVALTGDVTFTTSGRHAGKEIALRISADASLRNLTFPAWKWLGGAAPASIAASKTMIVRVVWTGTAETDAIATYQVEP